MVGEYWNGWTASQHVLRIRVDDDCLNAGYLYAFLCTEYAQSQISREIHGSVVDEINEVQMGNVLLPIPDKRIQASIAKLACDGVARLDYFRSTTQKATQTISAETGVDMHLADSKWHVLESNAVRDRLDATHYMRAALEIERMMASQSSEKVGRLASVFLAPRFRRFYVDYSNGIPFLSGKSILQVFPTPLQYLSRDLHADLIPLLEVKKGTILVTCSGTVGNIGMVWNQWNGWAASQHILRVTPSSEHIHPGFLYAFLMSPCAQLQIAKQVHGSVIDEITDYQLGELLVPLIQWEKQKEIGEKIHLALDALDEARSLISAAVDGAASGIMEAVRPLQSL